MTSTITTFCNDKVSSLLCSSAYNKIVKSIQNQDFIKAKLLFQKNESADFFSDMKKLEKINKSLYIELRSAVNTDNLVTAQFLLEHTSRYHDNYNNGCDDYYSSSAMNRLINIAISKGYCDMIKLLLLVGVKVKSLPVLINAIPYLESNIYSLLLENLESPSQLNIYLHNLMPIAMALCKKQHMNLFLEKGLGLAASIVYSIIHESSMLETTKFLIEYDVDLVDSVTYYIFTLKYEATCTELWKFVTNKKLPDLELLFKFGAKPKREYIGKSDKIDHILIKYCDKELYSYFDTCLVQNFPFNIKSLTI